MTTTTIEQELVELENQYWRAIRDRDTSAAMRLSEDPCIVTGAQGVASIDHKTLGGMLQSTMWRSKRGGVIVPPRAMRIGHLAAPGPV